MSSPVYVPVHKRGASASSTTSSSMIYSRDALLALAPSSSSLDSQSLSSSPAQLYAHHQPHQGWANLNQAMRNYIRLSCPEVAMNRKMRKNLEYQSHQQLRAASHSPERHTAVHPRPNSPSASSSTSSEDLHIRHAPVKVEAPPRPQPQRTTSSSSMKRIPSRRAPRATGTRARYTNFTAFHKQLASVATENEWRRTTVVAPLASH